MDLHTAGTPRAPPPVVALVAYRATAAEIVRAVLVVAQGDAVLAPSVTRHLLECFGRLLPTGSGAPSLPLTPRETEVLRLVAQGRTNVEIGTLLHVAESSVRTQVGHLLAKLGLPDRVHLVIHGYETGLVQASLLQTPPSEAADAAPYGT